MSNHESRVLGRLGARELTVSEMEMVAGSLQAHTNVCSVAGGTPTHTGAGDGDGCSDMDNS